MTHESGPRLATWKLRVDGAIKPKGSVSAFAYKDKATGKQKASVVHKRAKSSEAAIQYAASQALQERAGLQAEVSTYYRNPVSVIAVVTFEAPAWVRKRHKPVLSGPHKRPASFPLHRTRPDGDKLLRTILDALTDVAFNDDAQVFDKRCIKRYAVGDERPHATIFIGYYGAEYEHDALPAQLR